MQPSSHSKLRHNFEKNSDSSTFAQAELVTLLGAAAGASLVTAALIKLLSGPPSPETSNNVPNCAFVFLKPHANTTEARRAVKQQLALKGIRVTEEGEISGQKIEKEALIDNHYYSIASKATLLKPEKLNVPEEKFKQKFGMEWKRALSENRVFNAKDACAKLSLTSEGLNAEWAKSKKADKLVKFGGGFYCGLVDTIPGREPIYVMNGFFMSMRQAYVAPGASIYYYVVEWDSNKLSWEDFRGKVLGPTDPATASHESLRGLFMQNWRSLGLKSVPNVGENAVHASASPFESLSERMNWLGKDCAKDAFGRLVVKQIGRSTLESWKVDPTIVFGLLPIKKSVFDSLEDTDTAWCLALLGMLKQQFSTIA